MTEPTASADARERARWAWRVRIGLLLLAAFLVYDVTRLQTQWVLPRPVIASTLVEAADAHGRARMLNVVVAMAVREASPGHIPALIVPEGLDTLLEIDADTFGGRSQPTLNPSLMRPMLRDRITTESYDPVLDDETAHRLRSELWPYPRDVFIEPAAPDAGDEAGVTATYRLFVDETRTQVFLLPDTLLEDGEASSP